ncbi:MAG: alpha/beta hydrolase, partial [Cyanobacteria bacterium P01_A01_bin.105]
MDTFLNTAIATKPAVRFPLRQAVCLGVTLLLLTGCLKRSTPKPFIVVEDLEFATYSAGDGPRPLLLDLYLPNPDHPSQDSAATAHSLILYIHGGGWEESSRKICPGKPFSSQGLAMACISYRYSTEAIFPAQIHDVKAAVRWLRAHAETYRLDPNRFGVLGESAGGHLGLLLGLSADSPDLEGDIGSHGDVSSQVGAIVAWYPPTDLSQVPQAFEGPPTPDTMAAVKDRPWAHLTRLIYQLLDGHAADRATLAAMANPLTYITPDDPPVLV